MSFVYAIQAEDGGAIKIGTTTCPRSRLIQIQSCCPLNLGFVGLAKGGRKEERILHGKLREYRLRGEWFEPVDAVLAIVAEMGLLPTFVGRKSTTKADADRAKTLRLAGATYQKIGDELGVSRQRAHQLCRP